MVREGFMEWRLQLGLVEVSGVDRWEKGIPGHRK